MYPTAWPATLSTARLHVVSGKGGTGKTTAAAALALARLHLDQQHPAAVTRERDGESRRDRRLPGAALAGDDVQADAGEEGHRPRLTGVA